jgi:hypothetical protein
MYLSKSTFKLYAPRIPQGYVKPYSLVQWNVSQSPLPREGLAMRVGRHMQALS